MASVESIPSLIQENSPNTERVNVVASVFVEGKGYLCRLQKPMRAEEPARVVPIREITAVDLSRNDSRAAQSLLSKELGANIESVPTFNKSNTAPDEIPTKVFDMHVQDTAALEATVEEGNYVFVPEVMLARGRIQPEPEPADENSLPFTDTLEINGQETPVILHPDCYLLPTEPPITLEFSEKDEKGVYRKVAEKILTAIETLDDANDRLTLQHIKAMRPMLSDQQLANDLETAYIRERLVAIGMGNLTNASLEAGMIAGVVTNNPGLTVAAIGVLAANDLALDSLHGNLPPESFEDLLAEAFKSISDDYDLSKSGVNIHEIVFEAPGAFSDMSALKSDKASKWINTIANSAVLVANNQLPAAAAYAAASATLNVFGGRYQKYLERLKKEAPDSQTTQEEESWFQKNRKRFAEIAVRTLSTYSGNITAALPIAVHLASSLSSHQAELFTESKSVVKRRLLRTEIERLLTYLDAESNTLNTDIEYATYCLTKRNELARAGNVELELPAASSLVKEPPRRFKGSYMAVGTLPAEDKSTRKKYAILDAALDATRDTELTSSRESARQKKQEIRTKMYETIKKRDSHKPGSTEYQQYDQDFKDLTSELAEVDSSADQTALNTRAVLFANITAEVSGGEQQLLRNATFLATKGQVVELTGQISTRVLKTLAELQENSEGTTYIRTGETDINVHLDQNRSQIKYYSCKLPDSHRFFENLPPEESLARVEGSGMFDSSEIEEYKIHAAKNSFSGLSRSMKRRLAVIEGLSSDETVTILNYPFEDASPQDEQNIATYLATRCEDKIVIIRGDTNRTTYRQQLALQGRLNSYEISNRKIIKSPPIEEELMHELDTLGIPAVQVWQTDLKRRFAREILDGVSSMEKTSSGEYVRRTAIVRADVYTTDPATGTRYKLVQDQKIEPRVNERGVDITESIDRSAEPHSLYRSVVDGDPQATLNLRLQNMKINPDDVEISNLRTTVERVDESPTYQGMPTNYEFHDTVIEIPYEQVAGKTIAAPHASGGMTLYKLVEVSEEERVTSIADSI